MSQVMGVPLNSGLQLTTGPAVAAVEVQLNPPRSFDVVWSLNHVDDVGARPMTSHKFYVILYIQTELSTHRLRLSGSRVHPGVWHCVLTPWKDPAVACQEVPECTVPSWNVSILSSWG